jgi:small subunit ribosomal protein S17
MKKVKVGRVVSDRMTNTIVVRVEESRLHPRYRKHIRLHTKFHAHDARGEAGVGDLVRIEECRPISRMKRWRLVEILERSEERA